MGVSGPSLERAASFLEFHANIASRQAGSVEADARDVAAARQREAEFRTAASALRTLAAGGTR